MLRSLASRSSARITAAHIRMHCHRYNPSPSALPARSHSSSSSAAASSTPSASAASVPFLLDRPDSHTVSSVIEEKPSLGRYVSQVTAREKHTHLVDERGLYGGLDTAPSPYDLLLSALGACTQMTLRIYAERKKITLPPLRLRLRHSKKQAAEVAEAGAVKGLVDLFELSFLPTSPPLDPKLQMELLEVAARCPVHRTLSGNPKTFVRTRWLEQE